MLHEFEACVQRPGNVRLVNCVVSIPSSQLAPRLCHVWPVTKSIELCSVGIAHMPIACQNNLRSGVFHPQTLSIYLDLRTRLV